MTERVVQPLVPGAVAAAAGIGTFAVYLMMGAPAVHAGWSALLFAILVGLACIDAATETLPDVLTVAMVFTGVAHAVAGGATLESAAILPIGALALGLLYGKVTGDSGWIGSGDFFLAAGVLAWFGPLLALDVLILTSVFLMLHGILVRRATIAVAPSLALACTLIWTGGPIL